MCKDFGRIMFYKDLPVLTVSYILSNKSVQGPIKLAFDRIKCEPQRQIQDSYVIPSLMMPAGVESMKVILTC